MDAKDEFFHAPGEDKYWSESHYLDAVGGDVQAHARVGFYPNQGTANVFAYVLTDESAYWVRDEAVPLAAVHGLCVRRDDWTFRMLPEEPKCEWTLALEGTVTRTPVDAPGDVLAGRGDDTDLSIELTATSRHEPFLYSEGETSTAGDAADRYEVATTVEGTADVAGRELSFSGPGERDHSWGRRKWAGDAEWLWISGGFADGTAYNHLSFWLADAPETRMVNGFWFDGTERHPLTAAEVRERPAFSPETTREWMHEGRAPSVELELEWSDGATTVDVEPFATTPVDWIDESRGQRAVLNRSPASQTRDGAVDGAGFLENMGQLDHG